MAWSKRFVACLWIAVFSLTVTACGSSGTEGAILLPQPVASSAAADDPDLSQPLPAADGAVLRSQQSNGQVNVTSYLTDVIEDADRVWTEYFLRIGLQEPSVMYHILQPGQTFATQCHGYDAAGQPVSVVADADYPNAFYCSTDDNNTGALVLPVNTFAKMWTGVVLTEPSQVAGDFAAAAVVAHEFGHHIADELMQQQSWPVIPQPHKELIADCFSGVWSYSAYLSNYLEGTDVEEAVAAMKAIGDYDVNHPDHHGTPEQRAEAFLLGYNNGKPSLCINQYWPGAPAP